MGFIKIATIYGWIHYIKGGRFCSYFLVKQYPMLGVTSIVKIGEVRLSGEIGEVENSKKTNFIITIRYEILTFCR